MFGSIHETSKIEEEDLENEKNYGFSVRQFIFGIVWHCGTCGPSWSSTKVRHYQLGDWLDF
jgi:hypothetical protein